jgi:hypothetical protein
MLSRETGHTRAAAHDRSATMGALVTGAMDCAVMGAAQRYSGSSLPLRPPAAARGEDDERPMAYLY